MFALLPSDSYEQVYRHFRKEDFTIILIGNVKHNAKQLLLTNEQR